MFCLVISCFILIYSPDLVSHRLHVTQVLQRLLDNHLYVKVEKSEFHVNTISHLGFIVAPGRWKWTRPSSFN